MSSEERVTKIRDLRINLNGSKPSEVENQLIEKLNSKLAITLLSEEVRTLDLSIQSLTELVISALAYKAKTKEQLTKDVYSYMKDYFFPLTDKIGELLIERSKEYEKATNEEKAAKILGTAINAGMLSPKHNKSTVIQGSLDQVLDQLEQYVSDTCECHECVKRREREKQDNVSPNPNTKH